MLAVVLVLSCTRASETGPSRAAPPAASRAYTAIDTSGFKDGIKHYQNKTDQKDYPRYQEDQIFQIASNLLIYQRSNGGWPANFDPLRMLSALEGNNVSSQRLQEDTTFDNRATYPNIEYLAAAYKQTNEQSFLDAAQRGVEFVLKSQYENGGFPHSYPSKKDYRPLITFADDVMPGVLATLGRIAAGAPPFDAFDFALRQAAAAAYAKGHARLLALQIKVNGELTVWAGQYDPQTLLPAMGRSYELPALVSSESVAVVRYLMALPKPTAEDKSAIEAAVRWFERSKIQGIRVEEVPAEPVRYEYHSSSIDRRVVEDANAPPIWARFYEIETNRPFLANRDGRKVYTLAEVERERRTGYSWYNDAPAELLARDYPAWRARMR